MTQDDLNRVLTIQANLNAADAAAIQALIDAATEPAAPVAPTDPAQPGLYAVVDPVTNKVVEYVRGESPAEIIDKNRQYATYTFKWIEA